MIKRYRSCALLAAIAVLAMVSACTHPYYVQQHTDHLYVVEKDTRQDSAFVKMLHPYKRGVDTQMQVLIGRTDIPLTKAQPESTLGNFMADATLEAGKKLDPKTVAAVMNYGGIRINYINPGPITKGKIYELMPFDNMLTIVEMPGTAIQAFCDKMAVYKGWPVSNISFAIKDKKAINITIDGQALNEHIVYKIAVNDYIARGGDNCDFMVPLKKRHTTIFLRDILIAYVERLNKENRPLHPELENRIRYAE
ncbi:5'-nucleotidase C-terminal domain-containing protein [Taibaiella soli]|uniref:5'-Nucleotidase C-terminal domain-containing protein n=1 Tax=Taibaiella soli TaxID=1649169 RepID=A0A2W2AB01_9BACT|nr:5'-nucleotidase [Taibaiella soli]PZF72461.1 hypothetical protein DN068_14015 [Taibaiella soli]